MEDAEEETEETMEEEEEVEEEIDKVFIFISPSTPHGTHIRC